MQVTSNNNKKNPKNIFIGLITNVNKYEKKLKCNWLELDNKK